MSDVSVATVEQGIWQALPNKGPYWSVLSNIALRYDRTFLTTRAVEEVIIIANKILEESDDICELP